MDQIEPEVCLMEDILGRHPESLLRGAKRYVTTRKREDIGGIKSIYNKATRMLSRAWGIMAMEQGHLPYRPRRFVLGRPYSWDRWVDGVYGSYNSDDD